MAQCTARSKRTGQQCRDHAVIGRTVCWKHGGATLMGPAHPGWKTGRYSKLMAGSAIGEAYERARSDRQLMSLRDNIAACEVQAEELWGRLIAVETMEMSVERCEERDQVWRQLMDNFEQRRKLTETEAKTIATAHKVLTGEEAARFTAGLIDILTRHITDRELLQKIGVDIRALRGHGSTGA